MKKKEQKIKIELELNQSKSVSSPRKSVLSPRESVISWQAPEFKYYQKDVSWYWLSLIIAIIIVVLAIWQKNFLFAVFVVIAWFIIIHLAGRLPETWQFKIDEEGVEIVLPSGDKNRKKIYSYKEIEGFDIHSDYQESESDGKNHLFREDYKELVLKFKSKISPYFKINIPLSEEEKIKNFLLRFLPKEDYPVSASDSLAKLIKF